MRTFGDDVVLDFGFVYFVGGARGEHEGSLSGFGGGYCVGRRYEAWASSFRRGGQWDGVKVRSPLRRTVYDACLRKARCQRGSGRGSKNKS